VRVLNAADADRTNQTTHMSTWSIDGALERVEREECERQAAEKPRRRSLARPGPLFYLGTLIAFASLEVLMLSVHTSVQLAGGSIRTRGRAHANALCSLAAGYYTWNHRLSAAAAENAVSPKLTAALVAVLAATALGGDVDYSSDDERFVVIQSGALLGVLVLDALIVAWRRYST